MVCNDVVVKEGEWISVDGGTGEAYVGKIDMSNPSLEEQKALLTLLGWADDICATPDIRKLATGKTTRGLQVWANSDYPKDARRARAYGAVGIGLCRTEHMFFETLRLPTVQRMILAENLEDQKVAVDELLPFQRSDFDGLFEAMDGYPVIIRLIDPPLHEFMPSAESVQEEIYRARFARTTDYMLGKGEDKEIWLKRKTAGPHHEPARIQPHDGPARRPPEHLHARHR